SQNGQKPFQVMSTLQMQLQPFEEVSIAPEPGRLSPLCRDRKIFASNSFGESPHPFVGIHLAIFIHEQPDVY
ncbi:MAG TPA: hypothetical protein VNX46_12720, partial [Candidatus Acidoferrum sp.]|nr:hypothetical protein [Candidatus Acidoferrum sp.]